MTAIEVSSAPYHDAGASAVADVAFAVATGLDYLRVLTAAGIDLATAARQITFSLALGCRFYLAIAKIRAARKLWADVIDGVRRRRRSAEDDACASPPAGAC